MNKKCEKLNCEPNYEAMKRAYLTGGVQYVLGIDPGMNTWNATVRRDIATGKEVSN